jgi:uncharacterized protein (DUF305 family)
MHRRRTALAVALTTGLVAPVAACGSEATTGGGGGPGVSSVAPSASRTGSPDAGTAAHNGQDANFAADMISHHEQAVEMAELVPSRSDDPAVTDLAGRIQAAQGPEITTMKGWLKVWGLPEPENMSGMDMSDSMPGMMSPADLKELAGLRGAAFDRVFLTMMLAHHEGAITMAKTQITGGQSPEAKELAEQIINTQTKEIAEIRTLLR